MDFVRSDLATDLTLKTTALTGPILGRKPKADNVTREDPIIVNRAQSDTSFIYDQVSLK